MYVQLLDIFKLFATKTVGDTAEVIQKLKVTQAFIQNTSFFLPDINQCLKMSQSLLICWERARGASGDAHLLSTQRFI